MTVHRNDRPRLLIKGSMLQPMPLPYDIPSNGNLPEVTAIYEGADAIRAFRSAGGSFALDLRHTGLSLAHHAAIASYEHPLAVAAFHEAGGDFDVPADAFGRTPAFLLILCAQTPEALTAFDQVGGQFSASACVAVDCYGESLFDAATRRGHAFAEAVADLVPGTLPW
jgi:hypothetical protein